MYIYIGYFWQAASKAVATCKHFCMAVLHVFNARVLQRSRSNVKNCYSACDTICL